MATLVALFVAWQAVCRCCPRVRRWWRGDRRVPKDDDRNEAAAAVIDNDPWWIDRQWFCCCCWPLWQSTYGLSCCARMARFWTCSLVALGVIVALGAGLRAAGYGRDEL